MSFATVESVSEMAEAIGKMIMRRPIWIEQVAAHELAAVGSRTAPLWRWVRIAGPLGDVAARGTSVGATVGGAGSLALTLGVPIVVAAGVWVMLGSGYYQARQIAKKRGVMSGFSQGFTTGVLRWNWEHAVTRFGKPYVVNANAFDPGATRQETIGFNEGLVAGFAAGNATSDEQAKSFRIALRKLAGRTDAGDWSRDSDVARLQQVSYVTALAGAGVRYGLFVSD
jgi:hypothetical protein